MSEILLAVFPFIIAFALAEYYNRRIQRILEERIAELKPRCRPIPNKRRPNPNAHSSSGTPF